MEAEQPIQFAGNMQLRHPQLDVEVKGIGRDFGAKLAFSPDMSLSAGKRFGSLDIDTDGRRNG